MNPPVNNIVEPIVEEHDDDHNVLDDVPAPTPEPTIATSRPQRGTKAIERYIPQENFKIRKPVIVSESIFKRQ